jgi:hypothetical protein
MPFPYLIPVKDWLTSVLEMREKDQNRMTTKMPYVILTSMAAVYKDTVKTDTLDRIKQLQQLISGSGVYNGCVISNKTDIATLYSLGETLLGYDLNGKPIKVIGETNRRISTPIIESLEVDTDGANSTLKSARLSIKCFSLKQLEMFELFFLKPSMSLLVEFGDSSLLRPDTIGYSKKDSYTSPDQALVINNLQGGSKYDSFVEEYSKLAAADIITIKNYNKKIEKALGTYDFVAGKVTNFSYSIEDGGIYNISLEVSQGNQFSLAIPININKSNSSSPTPNKNLTTAEIYEQAQNQIIADLNLDSDQFKKLLSSGSNLENEFFNWGKLEEKSNDETVSLKPYISVRFIIKVLMNYSAYWNDDYLFKIPTYVINNKDTEYLPVKANKNLISSSEVVLFPNDSLVTYTLAKDSKTIIADPKNRKDCRINEYSFFEGNDVSIRDELGNVKPITTGTNEKIGNMLNAFILYSEVVQLWRKSYTRLDFIEQIIKLLNENGYTLWDLHTGPQHDGGLTTIIDYKLLGQTAQTDASKKIYRFKPGDIRSNVRAFTFNMELSNLVAGKTLFNTQKFMAEQIVEKNKNKNINFGNAFDEFSVKSVDMAQYTTSDGYYCIDRAAYKALQRQKGKLETQFKSNLGNNTEETKEVVESSAEKKFDENLQRLIKSKTINFKSKNGKEIMPLVFADKQTIQNIIFEPNDPNDPKNANLPKNPVRSTLTPIEISVTIDGLSGFTSGEYFNIDGVPETYNRDGVFQITNIKHSLNNDGWLTTLEAGWRIIK